MDRYSVAQMWGTCFAEKVAEIVDDGGGIATEEAITGYMAREYRVPAEIVERVMDYAARIGAVEITELADGSATIRTAPGYAPTSQRLIAPGAEATAPRATERGDYPVSYDASSPRHPATPAVMFLAHAFQPNDHQPTQSSRRGADELTRWQNEHRRNVAENDRIIERDRDKIRGILRPRPNAADRLKPYRKQIDNASKRNAAHYSRDEMKRGGCENTQRAEVRTRIWTEADRIIHYLYQRPGKQQEITRFYSDRGCIEPEAREEMRQAVNELLQAKRIRAATRNGKRYMRLFPGVKPRRYTDEDFEQVAALIAAEIQQATQEEPPEIEESYDPHILAEFAPAG